ncbi:MAG: 4'-phosphopantetheinyl transferase superfamily protein [Parabacteroides sp.]
MPLIYVHNKPHWGLWKVEESSEQLFLMLEEHDAYSVELEKIHNEHRRQEWLAARLLLQHLLGRFSRIAYHANGAPFLPAESLQISISHTKGYVAVILSYQAVGIDIEYRSDRILKVRSHFMTKEEDTAINLEHEKEHLLIYWCAKETLYKMIGSERVGFSDLHVRPFTFADKGQISAYETFTPYCLEFLLSFQITDDYVLTYKIEN